MVFGESVNLPMRVILNTLAADRRPHSSSAEFTDLWSAGEVSETYMDEVFNSWRTRKMMRGEDVEVHSQEVPIMQRQSRINPKPQARGGAAIRQQLAEAAQQINPDNANGTNALAGDHKVKDMLNRAFNQNI